MAPDSKEPFRFPTSADPARAEKVESSAVHAPSEDAIDHGIEETFPASDPVSVAVGSQPAAEEPPSRVARLHAYWRDHRTGMAVGSSLAALAVLAWRARRKR